MKAEAGLLKLIGFPLIGPHNLCFVLAVVYFLAWLGGAAVRVLARDAMLLMRLSWIE